jgi:hypothetical protein
MSSDDYSPKQHKHERRNSSVGSFPLISNDQSDISIRKKPSRWGRPIIEPVSNYNSRPVYREKRDFVI